MRLEGTYLGRDLFLYENPTDNGPSWAFNDSIEDESHKIVTRRVKIGTQGNLVSARPDQELMGTQEEEKSSGLVEWNGLIKRGTCTARRLRELKRGGRGRQGGRGRRRGGRPNRRGWRCR